MNYYEKYLKYKHKYLQLKMYGGGYGVDDVNPNNPMLYYSIEGTSTSKVNVDCELITIVIDKLLNLHKDTQMENQNKIIKLNEIMNTIDKKYEYNNRGLQQYDVNNHITHIITNLEVVVGKISKLKNQKIFCTHKTEQNQ
jgi:hypothetical protein